MAAIHFQNISKSFNAGKAMQLQVLQNVELKIESGAFVTIVGANGSGKSTLLNVIAGTVKPDSGNIYIDNNNLNNTSDFQRSRFIARIFQNPLMGTAADLSITENFRIAALRSKPKSLLSIYGKSFEDIVAHSVQKLNMNLESKLHQKMGTLSGGQRQALTLLMSVMDECKVLLLDEPVAALDPHSSEQVMQIANRLIAEYKLTAIMVTHSMKDACTYGNRIIQMKEGKILRDISGDEKPKLQVNDLYKWFE